MLQNYKQRSNIAGAVFLAAMVALIVLISPVEETDNLWVEGNLLAQGTFITMGISWFYALWAYAKAKGRSGLWALAGFLNVLGLIVLLLLKDRHASIDNG